MGLCLMSKIMLSGRYIWSLTQVSAQHIWPRWLQFANCIDYKTQCWPAGTQTTDQQFNTTLFGAERTLFIHQVQHTLKYSCYVYISNRAANCRNFIDNKTTQLHYGTEEVEKEYENGIRFNTNNTSVFKSAVLPFPAVAVNSVCVHHYCHCIECIKN